MEGHADGRFTFRVDLVASMLAVLDDDHYVHTTVSVITTVDNRTLLQWTAAKHSPRAEPIRPHPAEALVAVRGFPPSSTPPALDALVKKLMVEQHVSTQRPVEAPPSGCSEIPVDRGGSRPYSSRITEAP